MPKPKKPTKPKKTSNDFPLTAHAKNRRCQKFGLKMYDFGRWDNPGAALQEYLLIKDSLQVGIDPPKFAITGGATTVGDLVNHWHDQKNANLTAKDNSPQSFQVEKYVTCSPRFGVRAPWRSGVDRRKV